MDSETIEITSFADIEPVDIDVEETSVTVEPAPVEEKVELPVPEVKKEKSAKKSQKKDNTQKKEDYRNNLKEVYLEHKSYKGKAYFSHVEVPEMGEEYSCVKIAGKYYYFK